MRCALIRWWMDEYIDGRLSGKRLEWVQAHLQRCRSCAEELSWRRSLHSTLDLTVSAPPSQQMWQEFQQRLAQRTPSARPQRAPWWQVGTATAAVACALVLGVVWWARNPAPVEPISAPGSSYQTDSFARAPSMHSVPTPGAPSSKNESGEQDSRLSSGITATVKSRPKAPLPPRVALRYTPAKSAVRTLSAPAPQEVVSVAYAEVRNANGELVGKVLLQTTYDSTGQPSAIQIEADNPAVVEVETYEQPMDNSDGYSNTHGSADGTRSAASTSSGVSD